MRYGLAAFAAWVAAGTTLWALDWDWTFLALIATAPLIGALVGRWLVVPAPLVLPVVAAISGREVYDLGPAWQVLLVFFVPPTVLGLALGVSAGKLAPRIVRSRRGRQAAFR